MEGRARVGSIDALEAFRAALIRYTERSKRALDDGQLLGLARYVAALRGDR